MVDIVRTFGYNIDEQNSVNKEGWTVIVLEYASAYGISLQEARRLNAEEKKGYTEEWQNHMFVGISGTHVNLPFVHWTDLPDRDSDGAFANSPIRM